MDKRSAFLRARIFATQTGKTHYVVYDYVNRTYHCQTEYVPEDGEHLIDTIEPTQVPSDMTVHEREAYNWALAQEYRAVAARYAKRLAEYILRKQPESEG